MKLIEMMHYYTPIVHIQNIHQVLYKICIKFRFLKKLTLMNSLLFLFLLLLLQTMAPYSGSYKPPQWMITLSNNLIIVN